jgi:hypothetical protein
LSSPVKCPLCYSLSVHEFSNANDKLYYRCKTCSLISLDEKFFLPADEEKLRYQSHNNDPADERYIQHLSKLSDRLIPFLKPGDTGLDYGSGAGKPVSFILGKSGYKVSDYDPFFYDDKELLERKYDFITCTETAEHFHHPGKEFDLLTSLVDPGGILAIMTNFYSGEIDFEDWWYHRDPTHVCFYSFDTFHWLANKYKSEILLFEPSDNVIFLKKSLT